MGVEQYRITIKPERLLEPCFERSLRGWKVLDFDGHTYHVVAAQFLPLVLAAVCKGCLLQPCPKLSVYGALICKVLACRR